MTASARIITPSLLVILTGIIGACGQALANASPKQIFFNNLAL